MQKQARKPRDNDHPYGHPAQSIAMTRCEEPDRASEYLHFFFQPDQETMGLPWGQWITARRYNVIIGRGVNGNKHVSIGATLIACTVFRRHPNWSEDWCFFPLQFVKIGASRHVVDAPSLDGGIGRFFTTMEGLRYRLWAPVEVRIDGQEGGAR